jgi:hypothetical protein
MARYFSICASSAACGVMERFYCALNAGAPFFASTLDVFVKCACRSAAETAASGIYSFTITDVPSGAALKKCSAIPLGNRMQPCDAAYGGT